MANKRRKGDRLTAPGATKAEIDCDYAVAAMDEHARTLERKWGIDRLPALCSTETARKYGKAVTMLNLAFEAKDADRVEAIAAGCIRGLNAMDAEAEAAGAQPVPVKQASAEYEGAIITVVQEISDIENREKLPNEHVFTALEVAVLLKALKMDTSLVAAVKEQFPKAQIKSMVSKLPVDFWRQGGDVIDL